MKGFLSLLSILIQASNLFAFDTASQGQIYSHLNSTNPFEFQNEIQVWSPDKLLLNTFSVCKKPVLILDQQTQVISKLFIDFPSHEGLLVTFSLYVFNSWTKNSTLWIIIDDQTFILNAFEMTARNSSINCPDSEEIYFGEVIVKVYIMHNSSFLSLQIEAENSPTGVVGIRDLSIQEVNDTENRRNHMCMESKYFDIPNQSCNTSILEETYSGMLESSISREGATVKDTRILATTSTFKLFIDSSILKGIHFGTTIIGTIGAAFGISSRMIPIAFQMIPLYRFLYNIRFMDIDFDLDLKGYMIQMNATNLQSLEYNFISLKFETIPGQETPERYAGWGLSPSFLINYWPVICVLVLTLILAAVFMIAEKISRKYEKKDLAFLFENIKNIFKWNLFLAIFCSTFDLIILYAQVEFQSGAAIGDLFSKSGGLLAIAGIIFQVFLFYFTIRLPRHKYKARVHDEAKIEQEEKEEGSVPLTEHEKFDHHWISFRVLYCGLSDKKVIAKGFTFYILFRNALWILIDVLVNAPVIQAVVFCVLSILTIILMIVFRPYNDKVSKFAMPVLEIIALIVYIGVLVMAIDQPSAVLGMIVIYGSVAYIFAGLITVIIHIIYGIALCKKAHKRLLESQKKLSLTQILSLPFHSPEPKQHFIVPTSPTNGDRDSIAGATSLSGRRKKKLSTMQNLTSSPKDDEAPKTLVMTRKLFARSSRIFDTTATAAKDTKDISENQRRKNRHNTITAMGHKRRLDDRISPEPKSEDVLKTEEDEVKDPQDRKEDLPDIFENEHEENEAMKD